MARLPVAIRNAQREDVAVILALIADDTIGATRDAGEVDDAYWTAFDAIERDPRNELLVAESDGEVVGCLQLTYIPGLSRHGMERALVEAVRTRADRRGRGVGRTLIEAAIAKAVARGCGLVQLTSDKRRADAHRFYTGLGFVASHEGFKLRLR